MYCLPWPTNSSLIVDLLETIAILSWSVGPLGEFYFPYFQFSSAAQFSVKGAGLVLSIRWTYCCPICQIPRLETIFRLSQHFLAPRHEHFPECTQRTHWNISYIYEKVKVVWGWTGACFRPRTAFLLLPHSSLSSPSPFFATVTLSSLSLCHHHHFRFVGLSKV